MSRYRIIESAEHGIERVHTYDDLEIHHPSHHGHQPGRSYATVDGHREEVLKSLTSAGNVMVSKDFVLTDEKGGSHVRVPSPAAGYIGKVDPRNGLVGIYDHKGGELIAQVRHMDLHGSGLQEGQSVAYGQPLGYQSGYGHGKPDAYGVHTHIDFNTGRLQEFKRYFSDIDGGIITIGNTPTHQHRPHGALSTGHDAAALSGVTHQDREELGTRHAQVALAHLGYTGADGRPLQLDGVLGPNSRHAIGQFQHDHGMHANGHLDARTVTQIGAADHTLASSVHPAHALYRQSLDAVRELDRQSGIPSGAHTIPMAGVVAAEAVRAGLSRVDRVELGKDLTYARGVEFSRGVDDLQTNRTSAPIDVSRAVRQSLDTSSQQAADTILARSSVSEHLRRENVPLRAPVM